MRCGIIAKKLGMSRVFGEDGRQTAVTVLSLDGGCQVVAQRHQDKDGYTALQVGVGKAKRVTKPLRGHFAKAKVEPKRLLAEFRVDSESMIDVQAEIQANHFVVGQYVDAMGTSVGKGFAGAMKRHNFKGLRATHGVSISHRSHGSTGQCQDPGRVFKGKKMAGHMGQTRVTVQSLKVMHTDVERGVILVKGAVPGSSGSFIFLKDSARRPLPKDTPMPGAFVMPSSTGASDGASTEANTQAGGDKAAAKDKAQDGKSTAPETTSKENTATENVATEKTATENVATENVTPKDVENKSQPTQKAAKEEGKEPAKQEAAKQEAKAHEGTPQQDSDKDGA